MAYLEAECTIILGGLTLLELDVDLMEGETSIAQHRVVQLVQPIRADFAEGFSRKNIRNSFTWSRVKRFATADQARLFKITHAAELPTTVGDCTLTYPDGTLATFSNATLESDCYSAHTKAGLFLATYRISCGAIIITPPSAT